MTDFESKGTKRQPKQSVVATGLAAEYFAQGKVEKDEQGKIVVRMALPREFEGHSLAVDFHSNQEAPKGPFRFEYVLGSEFNLYRTDLGDDSRLEGCSNLDLGTTILQNSDLKVSYATGRNADAPKRASLAFKGDNGKLQRIVVEMPEEDLDYARQVAEQIVNGILDYLVFAKDLPLKVIRLDIFETVTDLLHRRYFTIPYTRRGTLEIQDLEEAKQIPTAARAALRLFREAVGSTNHFYRFLCYYRVHEALEKLRKANNKAVRTKGGTPQRTKVLLGESDLAKRHYPSCIGKPAGKLLEVLRSDLRINIAHMNMDDLEQMILDPGNTGAAHKVDIANALMDQVMRGLLESELKFMSNHQLR